MKRTSIFLPDEMHEALRTRAFMGRTTIAEEIRRAVELYLQKTARRTGKEAKETRAEHR